MDTSQLVRDVQDQVRADQEGDYPDWALALLDGCTLAQTIGILPQILEQCRLLFNVQECGSSSLFQPRRDSVQLIDIGPVLC